MSKLVRELEGKIVEAVVRGALKGDYRFVVESYGEDNDEKPHGDTDRAIKELMDLDDAYLFLWEKNKQRGDLKPQSWVRFVFGNDGWDVINDYTVNLEKSVVLKEAMALSAKYED